MAGNKEHVFEISHSEMGEYFSQLDPHPTNIHQRERKLLNGKISITDLTSATMDAYLVRSRNVRFILSKKQGIENLNLPDLVFPMFDNHVVKLEPIDPTKLSDLARIGLAETLTRWVERSIESGIIPGVMAFEPKFHGETKF